MNYMEFNRVTIFWGNNGSSKTEFLREKREKYKTIQFYSDTFCHDLFGSEIWFLLLSLG